MKKITKHALLLAFFAQKPSKEDAPFLLGASVVITFLLLFGAVLESEPLFRIGVGLILVVPFVRGVFLDYKKHKGTNKETAYTILLWFAVISGVLFLLSMAASFAGLVKFTFICLIALPFIDGAIELKG